MYRVFYREEGDITSEQNKLLCFEIYDYIIMDDIITFDIRYTSQYYIIKCIEEQHIVIFPIISIAKLLYILSLIIYMCIPC